MLKKVLHIIFILSCIGIGLYPILYFLIDQKFGLLTTKSADLLASEVWNVFFYLHIVLGGLALLIGWIQFLKKFREKNLSTHRIIGKIYVASCFISGISGLYIAYYATGGLITKVGFSSLAILWLYTTYMSFTAVKKGDIQRHLNLMIYSYALTFGAVTLRIWLPLLTMAFGEFLAAYKVVSWLAWVPNVIVAYFIVKNQSNINYQS
ncbi:MAG: hypothetical protein CMB99_05055 [Flavobacteriaceae bacterium]|nr:hypothetical protein [Flavobacteriaceae bacterium]|tara:strand:+ start:89492 stop:90112 length:621 start_codon:yes stop_codon:yes gene_type:complete